MELSSKSELSSVEPRYDRNHERGVTAAPDDGGRCCCGAAATGTKVTSPDPGRQPSGEARGDGMGAKPPYAGAPWIGRNVPGGCT